MESFNGLVYYVIEIYICNYVKNMCHLLIEAL